MNVSLYMAIYLGSRLSNITDERRVCVLGCTCTVGPYRSTSLTDEDRDGLTQFGLILVVQKVLQIPNDLVWKLHGWGYFLCFLLRSQSGTPFGLQCLVGGIPLSSIKQ